MYAVHQSRRFVGRIPVQNLWLLMLYASELTRFRDSFDVLVEKDIDYLPGLVAALLTDTVERRLRRNLSRQYQPRHRVLRRVRGHIDMLQTETRQLLSKGEISCRFDELTINTPRNRYVRAALDLLSRLVDNRDLAHRCRSLAGDFGRQGVGGPCPSRAEMTRDSIGRNEVSDRTMVALARLAFDLALPTEETGETPLFDPEREETWVRRLFEKAIFGFARVELESREVSVRGGIPLDWQIASASSGLEGILPRMVTDIKIDPLEPARRLVVDTKFASVLAPGRFGQTGLKSGYLYQMYAYLRSQEGLDTRWDSAAGLFLHPAIECSLHETVVIQGHPIMFATVDLAAPAAYIRNELRAIFEPIVRGEI
jgi:5-methylcytosine-specific restriction enzyme subunit McrC